MHGLYTNSNQRRDFVRNPLVVERSPGQRIYIASAFFTEHQVLTELANSAEEILLVVRLGFPTSPDALAASLKHPKVQVRYYSDPSFHPKLYLFGDESALVGSANLTGKALVTNQEVVVRIDAADLRFAELQQLFQDYWSEALVLTPERLDLYRVSYARHARIAKDIEDMDRHIESTIGVHVFPNIDRGTPKKSHQSIFFEDYRRSYQEATAAFAKLREAYEALGRRKVHGSYPLRLEIDLLINYVRDHHTSKDSWAHTPIGWTEAQKQHFTQLASEWIALPLNEFERTVVEENYSRLTAAFASEKHLLATTDDELFQALQAVHSFRDRLRFHAGGTPGLRDRFLSSNDPQRLRKSLAHLIFGRGDVVARMADLIFNPNYKLPAFGRANVQELIGWLSQGDLPSVNGRTTKILRYFGFPVRQLASE